MKKVFIFLISILLVFTIIISLKERNIEKDDKKSKVTTTINKEVEKTDENQKREEVEETKKERTDVVDEKMEVVENTEPKKDNVLEQKTQKRESTTETKKTTSNQDKNNNESKTNIKESTPVKEEPKKEVENGTVDSNGNNIKEEQVKTVVKEPWEKLGISKEDYENKPQYSWMRVDYNVTNCRSVNNCEAICMSDSEELSYTENVSCIEVYSHSGKYLGEMLKRN